MNIAIHCSFEIDKDIALLVCAIVFLMIVALMIHSMAITYAATPSKPPIIIAY